MLFCLLLECWIWNWYQQELFFLNMTWNKVMNNRFLHAFLTGLAPGQSDLWWPQNDESWLLQTLQNLNSMWNEGWLEIVVHFSSQLRICGRRRMSVFLQFLLFGREWGLFSMKTVRNYSAFCIHRSTSLFFFFSL